MKLFLVTPPYADYDEYEGFVIWAETEEQALQIAIERAGGETKCSDANGEYIKYFNNFAKNAEVEEITEPSTPEIVLEAFRSG